MQIGDLVYLKPRNTRIEDENYIGLLLNKERIGDKDHRGCYLYDVLFAESNEVITISDIYFEIRRIE